MSPDPTSLSPLVAAAMTAGSGHSPEVGGASSATASDRDGSALVTPGANESVAHTVPPVSGKHPSSAAYQFSSTAAPPVAAQPAATPPPPADANTAGMHVIKRYSNRKLYDTKSSRYVTLLQIAEMVRAGEDVRIVDNRSKEDKTEATLALIISEELKASPRGIPLATLRALIREGGDCSRWFSAPQPPDSEALWRAVFDRRPSVDGASDLGGRENGSEPMKDLTDAEMRANFERWCAAIDQRMRALPDASALDGLKAHVQHLNERLAELERRLERRSE